MTHSKLFQSQFSDNDVMEFIDTSHCSWTYSKIATQIEEKFGADRAWTIDRIRAYCLMEKPPTKRRPFGFLRDQEVANFVDDRIGRVSFVALADECRQRFGAHRAPGKSTLHEYAVFLREAYRQH